MTVEPGLDQEAALASDRFPPFKFVGWQRPEKQAYEQRRFLPRTDLALGEISAPRLDGVSINFTKFIRLSQNLTAVVRNLLIMKKIFLWHKYCVAY